MLCLLRNLPLIPPAISAAAVRLTTSAIGAPTHIHHIITTTPEREIIDDICDSLRKGLNWNTLTKKFNSLDLNKNSPIIQKVLLQLKQPLDARLALGFFHWSIKEMQQNHDPFVYCITIHIVTRAKLIKDAQALLESVLIKTKSGIQVTDLLLSSYDITESTPFVFNLVVQSCAKLRMIDDAISVCDCLDKLGFKLSIVSYNTLIHVIQKSEKTHLVWKIYEDMISRRVYPNEFTVRIMISALCKEGKLQKVMDVVDRIHGKRCLAGVVVNSCLVYEMIEEGRIDEGLGILKLMLLKNMILDTISYSFIVFARVTLGDVGSAIQVYEEMLKRGFNANSFVHTLFIGAYCGEGKVEEAIGLFCEMENVGLKPYDATFNHLILGCSKVGRLEDSLRFCRDMVDVGLVCSCVSFNELVQKMCDFGDAKGADDLLTSLLDKGFVPNENTYSHLIDGYRKEGNLQCVLKLYHEMEYKSLSPSYSVFVSLIATLVQFGNREEADNYLKIMKDRSLVPRSYTHENLMVAHFKKGTT